MNERVRSRIDDALGVVGKTFITAGLLLLGLVAYQLWGTGIETSRAQARLHREFTRLITNATTTTGAQSITTTNQPAPSLAVPNRPNSAVALLEVPTAGISDIVVEGVSASALRHGPGHVPRTALPGDPGNSAIAGHRTTYGAPFADLDRVDVGDDVTVTTTKGRFDYEVIDVRIIKPNQTEVLRPQANKTLLTLITCNPRYSTSQRLVVVAELRRSLPLASATTTSLPATGETSTSAPATSLPTTTAPTTTDQTTTDQTTTEGAEVERIDGWFSDHAAILPSILLGAALAMIAIGTRFVRLGFVRRGRSNFAARATSWAIAAVPFLVTLFFWYRFINLLLPAST